MSSERDKMLDMITEMNNWNYKKDKIIEDLQSQLDKANEKIMWLNAEIDALKSEKENLMRTLEEASEELEGAIVPRFKKGDTAYAIMDTTLYTDVFKVNILDTELCYKVDRDDNDISTQHYTRLFSNKQEAQAKLQELRGGE